MLHSHLSAAAMPGSPAAWFWIPTASALGAATAVAAVRLLAGNGRRRSWPVAWPKCRLPRRAPSSALALLGAAGGSLVLSLAVAWCLRGGRSRCNLCLMRSIHARSRYPGTA